MKTEEVRELIIKYNAGNCTEAEKALVEDSFMRFNEHPLDISTEEIEELGKQVYQQLPVPDEKKRTAKLWSVIITVAAAIAFTMSIWLYWAKNEIPAQTSVISDISPGGNRATITLSDGKKINLSKAQTGIIIDASKVIYNDGTAVTSSNNSNVIGYHTLNTPKGGQYQIILSDGTKVWLNAASTLKFPATFSRLVNRKVELSGEAYFEVAKDKGHPFIVQTKNQAVKVLGTHFNINAYSSTETKTTLLEGSVEVALRNTRYVKNSVLLKPGEQAVNLETSISIKPADLDLETAWKNGKIQFEDAELRSVMSILVRWYDIDVEYKYYPSEARFSGSIARSKNISEVLALLESTGDAHFKISGRKVLIMK